MEQQGAGAQDPVEQAATPTDGRAGRRRPRWGLVVSSQRGRSVLWHTGMAVLLTCGALFVNPYDLDEESHGADRTLVVTVATPPTKIRAAIEVALHASATRETGLLNVAVRNSRGGDPLTLGQLIGGLRLHVAGDRSGKGLRCRHGVGANAGTGVGLAALVEGPSSLLDSRPTGGTPAGAWREVPLAEGDAWTFSCEVPDVLARERTSAGTRTVTYLGTEVRLGDYFTRTQLSRGEAEARSAPGLAQRTILGLDEDERVVDALPQPTSQVGSTVSFHNVGRSTSPCGTVGTDPVCEDLVVDYGQVVADWGSTQRSAEAEGVLFGLLAGLAATLWVDAVRTLVRIL